MWSFLLLVLAPKTTPDWLIFFTANLIFEDKTCSKEDHITWEVMNNEKLRRKIFDCTILF